DVERAVAHDHLLAARPRSDRTHQLIQRLDFAAIISFHRPRYSNQVSVAAAIDGASQTGASSQRWISRTMDATPYSKETCGPQPTRSRVFGVSAQVQSGSPGRFGT